MDIRDTIGRKEREGRDPDPEAVRTENQRWEIEKDDPDVRRPSVSLQEGSRKEKKMLERWPKKLENSRPLRGCGAAVPSTYCQSSSWEGEGLGARKAGGVPPPCEGRAVSLWVCPPSDLAAPTGPQSGCGVSGQVRLGICLVAPEDLGGAAFAWPCPDCPLLSCRTEPGELTGHLQAADPDGSTPLPFRSGALLPLTGRGLSTATPLPVLALGRVMARR